jgi:DEAD/DEAH box helicase domain-containing protein
LFSYVAKLTIPSTINSIIQILCIETPWAGASGAPFRTKMINYLLDDLLSDIQEVVDNPVYTQEALSERLANAGLLPMFGFPTRVRSLYTHWPSPHQQWPPESGTIERDLDVAISQFAPGSQTVKDKAVHTAVGVVDFKRIGNRVISEDGLAPPLSLFNQKPTGLCDYCQAVIVQPPLSVIPPGGQEPQKDTCPVCNSSPPSLRILDAREPRGFFTDNSPDDFDGQFEWRPRSTRPSLGINTPANTSSINLENCIIRTFKDHVLSLNDDGGQGGFDFQDTKVFSTPRPGAYAVPTTSSAASSSMIGPYISAYGPSRRIALLSRRMTDILLVSIDKWPVGTFADPTNVVGRAAWYSFAFLLRTAAAAHLDIDTLELQAGFRSTRSSNNTVIGEAFLSDQLENGAGYCQFLGQKTEFERLLLQGNPIVSGSLAAKWADLSSTAGANTSHAIECDTSCNRCLRDFQNLPYHGLLDWRLALDMMRLATSSAAAVDLITSWDSLTNPWVSLTSGVNAPVPGIMKRLLYGDPVQFGTLRGYIHQLSRRKEILIERHPLRQDDHPVWLVAKTDAEVQYPGYTIHDMNPFIALRRPSDYA